MIEQLIGRSKNLAKPPRPKTSRREKLLDQGGAPTNVDARSWEAAIRPNRGSGIQSRLLCGVGAFASRFALNRPHGVIDRRSATRSPIICPIGKARVASVEARKH